MSVVIGAPKRLRLPDTGIAHRYVVAPCFRLVSAIAEYRWIDITAIAVLSASIAVLSAVAVMAIAVGNTELLALEMLTLGGISIGLGTASHLMRAVKENHWTIRFAVRSVAIVIAVVGVMVTLVSTPYFMLEFLSTLVHMGIGV